MISLIIKTKIRKQKIFNKKKFVNLEIIKTNKNCYSYIITTINIITKKNLSMYKKLK